MTRGYAFLPERNSQSFVDNPFAPLVEAFTRAGYARPHLLYKTGDLALRNESGDLEFRGRDPGDTPCPDCHCIQCSVPTDAVALCAFQVERTTS